MLELHTAHPRPPKFIPGTSSEGCAFFVCVGNVPRVGTDRLRVTMAHVTTSVRMRQCARRTEPELTHTTFTLCTENLSAKNQILLIRG